MQHHFARQASLLASKPVTRERNLLGAKDLHPRLDVGELLVLSSTRWTVGCTEDELRPHVPVSRQAPLGGDALSDALLVVLQAAAEAFGAECGPG